MTSDLVLEWAVYVLPTLCVIAAYQWRQREVHLANTALLLHAHDEGATEPASLYPLIDESRCLGCGSCEPACPEHDVLGLISGKAKLLAAANCIGHGACAAACPNDAITLVIGTEKRGVDIPVLNEDFQTVVPGLYVVGELGGIGLIHNAIEQGRQVIGSLQKGGNRGDGYDFDVVVIGAGPAGLSASLAAHEAGLDALTIEQESLGGTVAHYPRRKLVLTHPVVLPTVGRLNLRETTKEALLELWTETVRKAGLNIRFGERVEGIKQVGGGLSVDTSRGSYHTRAVVLAIGRRGSPRKLGVEGEDQPKVVYRLVDPAQYRGLHVLVVGGGDSALEAANSLAEEPGTTVTLSYRGDGFGKAKSANREKIAAFRNSGRVNVLLESNVSEILASSVRIRTRTEEVELPNDIVIVCAGGTLPTKFLHAAGVETRTLHGVPPMAAAPR